AFADNPDRRYPAPMPYVIAETEKGFGFPGAGTNAAHNLPLDGNPHLDESARALFNRSAANLYVPPGELEQALEVLANHGAQGRPLESGHPMAHRNPPAPSLPEPAWLPPGGARSAMDAVDDWFVELAK